MVIKLWLLFIFLYVLFTMNNNNNTNINFFEKCHPQNKYFKPQHILYVPVSG